MHELSLPMDLALPEVARTLKENSSLVVQAEPGAGKTTRLPPALCELFSGKILVLEPRRIAAISAATRIAEENSWNLGRQVGYQVRFESKVSADTKLIFLTEALLLKKLMQDPELKGVDCVVLDEFHERSVHVDLALAALKELQELTRPDLKIIVMSATLETQSLQDYLDAPIISVPGKVFPLEIFYEKSAQQLQTNYQWLDRMFALLVRAHKEAIGDILCFLPGRGEIERLREKLSESAIFRDSYIATLHGQLSLAEQKGALAKNPKRKVILSTNVAESSLTVEGVRVVVDSGLARIVEIHPRTGFESMELVRISKASAKQRAGRAARNGPGFVFRAWIPMDELSMRDFELPEIHRIDLAETILLLASIGIHRPESFSWFDRPKAKALLQAQEFLRAIGAMDLNGDLTTVGREISRFPLPPRISRLLLEGRSQGAGSLACEVAAILTNPLPAKQYGEGENDLSGLLEDWRAAKSQPRYRQLERTYQHLLEILNPTEHRQDAEMEDFLIQSYADRLCRRRKANDPQAKMAGGRGVRLHADSSVKKSEYFLALELKEGRDSSEALVFQAIGLEEETVLRHFQSRAEKTTRLEWDSEKERFWCVESNSFLGVSIGREHRRPPLAHEVEGKLAIFLVDRWDLVLARNSGLSRWVDRVNFLASQGKFPALSEEQKKAALDLACFEQSNLQLVLGKDLVSFFEAQLESSHRSALQRECPEEWIVPTGNRMPIQYSLEQGAQVEVRLQELFGLAEAPKVGGKSLTLILLAPNFRPVQVTRDLASFWKNGYPEVKKELKTRYPKHSWPDNPLTAIPQAKGRGIRSK